MFPRLPARATFVAGTQKVCVNNKIMFPSLRSMVTQHSFCVPGVCAPKKHHEQQCARNNVSSFATAFMPRSDAAHDELNRTVMRENKDFSHLHSFQLMYVWCVYVHLIGHSPSGLFRTSVNKYWPINITRLRIPTGGRQTSWLFTSVAVKLNSGLPRTSSASGQNGIRTRDLRISNPAL